MLYTEDFSISHFVKFLQIRSQMAVEGSLIPYSINDKSDTKLNTISAQYSMNI